MSMDLPFVVWLATTDFAKIGAGENYNVHQDNVGGTSAVAQNKLVNLNISGAFTGVASEDLVGLEFKRDGDHGSDTLNGPCLIIGVRIRYV